MDRSVKNDLSISTDRVETIFQCPCPSQKNVHRTNSIRGISSTTLVDARDNRVGREDQTRKCTRKSEKSPGALIPAPTPPGPHDQIFSSSKAIGDRNRETKYFL